MTQLSPVQLLDGFENLLSEDTQNRMSANEAREWLINASLPENIVGSIAIAAHTLRKQMETIVAPANAIDVCGTGGDGQHTLNISTAVAIVVAACGVPVAKHGNRAASSKAGGADTLEALGLNLANASARASETLKDMNVAFLFAQKHHPSLAWLAPIRKEIGQPTVLNYIGPLCSPARVKRQLIGVPNQQVFNIFSNISWDSQELQMERVMIASGAEGLDEISISGETHIKTFGFNYTHKEIDRCITGHPVSAIRGGDAVFNAAALRKLLVGASDQNLAYREAVLINAAAALMVAGEVTDIRSGVEEAAEAIDKGLAKILLDCWIKYCE